MTDSGDSIRTGLFRRRPILTGALLGAGLTGILVWAVFQGFGLRLSRTAGSIPFEAYPEPPMPPAETVGATRPRNIIVFVADGLGFAHLTLAQQAGSASPVWREFDVRAWHDPRPLWGSISDSASSATALATGRLTHNDRLGTDEDNRPVLNLFEAAWAAGYRTGVVTDSYVWDATPAAFVVHTASRDNARDILEQLARSRLDVLLGELEDVGEEGVPTRDETVEILGARFRLLGPDLEAPADRAPVAALFPEDSIMDSSSRPSLDAMTRFAIERLTAGDEPFLLLVEGEEVDSASHKWDAPRVLRGLDSIADTLTGVLAFAEERGDTLVVFTSDHETGGLALSYELSSYPDLVPVWGSRDHSAGVVPLLASGPGAERFAGIHRVWEVGAVLNDLIEPGTAVAQAE